jgi:hypothetical protein
MLAMLGLFRELEHIHPFRDCNCRVFFTLLLNRELIRNGFRFAIFPDPNRLDGHDLVACAKEIINGFKTFEQVKGLEIVEGFKTTAALLALGHDIPITPRKARESLNPFTVGKSEHNISRPKETTAEHPNRDTSASVDTRLSPISNPGASAVARLRHESAGTVSHTVGRHGNSR